MIHDSKTIHMVGIKGQGMAALTEILAAEGKHITGSDTAEVFSTDAVLQKRGVRVLSFNAKNITRSLDLVIYSSAYDERNAELAAAKKLGIPMIPYSDAVAEIFNKKRGILITGTHGKTTTTAMIGCILEDAGFDPTVLVGATVRRWGRNARWGRGAWMVAEGDEYQDKFLKLRPEVLVVTSIEYDHPDYFKTYRQYESSFLNLIHSLPKNGLLVAERGLTKIIKKAPCKIVWYGISGPSFAKATEGKHMELNGKAASIVAHHLGIPVAKAKKTLKNYEGTARRMEFYTKPGASIVIIDDYAHHPTEIKTTLAAVRRQYTRRIVTALFQPHTYSRTHELLDDFAKSFKDADEVLLLPIYSSARENKRDFPKDLEEQLFRKIMRSHKSSEIKKNNIRRIESGVYSMQSFTDAVRYCNSLPQAKQKRVIITLGAGNGWEIARDLTKTNEFIQEEGKDS